jgi:toxin ParE1/3/4
MVSDLRLTRLAENDVLEIWNYIAAHDAPAKADYVLGKLEAKIAILVRSPNLGNVPKEAALLGLTQYRELHWKPYRVVYELRGDIIYVLAVLDGRRDIASLLRQRLMR